MKNKFALLIIVFSSFLLSFVANGQTSEKKIALSPFSRIIVKSNLRIVLVENDKIDSARIEGSKKFLETVMILQSGEELIIRAKSFKDLKKEGTIYVPVHNLQYLEVNSDAKIISYTTINSPQLYVLINGDCILSIVLNGKLSIHKADGFEYAFHRVNYQSNTPVNLNNFINH
jgi:hypothetical protein